MEEKKSNEKPESRGSRPSALSAWALAARPKTLAAAGAPVVVALALAYRDIEAGRVPNEVFSAFPAACCLAFALLAQIAANFVNDYADFKKGADSLERKGPRRAVANGWITPRAMLVGALGTLGVACVFGLATLFYVSPGARLELVGIGALCCAFCILYSAGPKPLSYVGLGDVLVVAFFGIVAVCYTYFLQTGKITADALALGAAIGFATDNILVSNNYRDRDEDAAAKKRTLVVIFGERFGRYFYLANGALAVALAGYVFARRGEWNGAGVGALVVYLLLHWRAWRTLSAIRSGTGLVRVLALSSRNLLVLSVMLAVALVY